MLQQDKRSSSRKQERRIRWRDRRVMPDRRNPDRLQRSGYDCRSGIPRRDSDIGGELAEGVVWWEDGDSYL